MSVVKPCKDCGEQFIVSEGELAWYKRNELLPPVRCKSCRAKRKALKELKKQRELEQETLI